MAEQEERTEQATPRRRQKAREKGQVARSRELVSMATMAGVLLVFFMSGTVFMREISGLTGRLLGLGYGRDAHTVLRSASIDMLRILAPILLTTVIFAVLANVAQGGVPLKPLRMELERLNPLTGLGNIFSVSSLPGIFKSILKFIIGGAVFYYLIKKLLIVLPMTSAMDVHGIQDAAFLLTGRTVAAAFGVFFVVAATDYFYERWRFERSLRMTREEIREEFRESEGDPLIKAKIRSMQKEMARRRMMEAVPKATVVITNPTHIAVALLYEQSGPAAPKVVAKGAGLIAEKIREIARRHGVPIVEDKPLARSLNKLALDSFIPEELYRAVAKILAYIYGLKKANGAHPRVSPQAAGHDPRPSSARTPGTTREL